jgi:hypothetical protein
MICSLINVQSISKETHIPQNGIALQVFVMGSQENRVWSKFIYLLNFYIY